MSTSRGGAPSAANETFTPGAIARPALAEIPERRLRLEIFIATYLMENSSDDAAGDSRRGVLRAPEVMFGTAAPCVLNITLFCAM
jgi:hypothetical protein